MNKQTETIRKRYPFHHFEYEKFPYLNVSNIRDFSYMWERSNFTKFPKLDTSTGVIFSCTWASCDLLKIFPHIDTLNGTDFSSAWASCKSLKSFPKLNMSKGNYFNGAWSECNKLLEFPFINLENGVNFESTWRNCNRLEYFPPNMFDNLSKLIWPYCFSHTWENCNLNTQSVENILLSINRSKAKKWKANEPIIITIDTQPNIMLTDITYKAIKTLKNKNFVPVINGEIK